MFFNKNGLRINLNFDHSLNKEEINELENKNINKHFIKKESAIFFAQTSKSIKIEPIKEKPKLLRKSSYNFPIISKLKISKDLIINKTTKFEILKSTKVIQPSQNILKITKSNDINIIIPRKNNETEINKCIKIDTNKAINSGEKIFQNLNSFSSSNIFIEGGKKNNIFDIQYKINNLELIGKPKTKCFEVINITPNVIDLIIEKKLHKETDVKTDRTSILEIKKNIEPKMDYIETNIISFLIKCINEKKEKTEKNLFIQNNINNFEIISKRNNRFKNLFEVRIINFVIKIKQKKKRKISPNIIFKKVDGFGNINNKLFIKDINNKDNIFNENKDNIPDIKKNEKKEEFNLKIDKFKTKTPNHIEIKIKNNNQNNDNNNNFNINGNGPNSNKIKKLISSNKENKNSLTNNTINDEIYYNKQTIDFPLINTDILHLEEQYEKIKKDLNELYPIFDRNKKYRENFFMQLSQGNQDKYNFYLGLYKIIKDEQDEKNNNNYKNYLKMKEIIGNKKISGIKNNLRNRLKPLKKNKSSHLIIAKDKIKPLYTEI